MRLTCTLLLLLACMTAFAQDTPAVDENGLEKPPVLEAFTLRHNLGEDNLPKDGKTTDVKGWVECDFQGKGEVRIEDGVAILGKGNDMTGIKWTGPLAKMNYEISLEAKRIEGSDFFCALTFPYGEKPCSFVVGGWGGTVCGISSIDFQDAYNNNTCKFRTFEDGRWYNIRVRITEKRIQAWLDQEELVNVKTVGKEIGIRGEVEPCRPLGVATWRTTGAIRNVDLHVFTTPPPDQPAQYEDDENS